ncbi:hypothetical protein [Nonomuraea sp. B12E4]|uniref:hypothetical protein n=1 Tax=Nonomuraea sp. B12E4 TaxID=3153564 RepID=UPI00325FA488
MNSSLSNHLRVPCTAARLPLARAGEALERVGLADVAGKRVGILLGLAVLLLTGARRR